MVRGNQPEADPAGLSLEREGAAARVQMPVPAVFHAVRTHQREHFAALGVDELRRIVEKDDEIPVTVPPGGFKGEAQALHEYFRP